MTKNNQTTENTNFMFFIHELWRKKALVIIVTVAALLLGAVWGFVQMPRVEQGANSDGLYRAQTQIIIRDDSNKQVIIDHKNNIAAMLTSPLSAAQCISAYSLEMDEDEFVKSLNVTTAGSSVVNLTAAFGRPPETVKEIVDSLSEFCVKQYKTVYPEIEVSKTETIIIGGNFSVNMSIGQKAGMVAKYSLVGAVIGLAAVLVIIALCSVFNNKINTSCDVEGCLELPVIAECANDREGVKRIAVSLLGRNIGATVSITGGENSERERVVCGTALELSRLGKKVLVIDGDLKKGNVGETLLGADAGVTLARGINDNLPAEELIRSNGRVSVVAAGRSDDAFDVISSEGFENLLEYAEDNFDIILINTPDTAVCPEGLRIATLSKGAIYVVRARTVTYKSSQAAVEELRINGVKLFGAVLNK